MATASEPAAAPADAPIRQPCLFEALPTSEPRRRRNRRAPAPAPALDILAPDTSSPTTGPAPYPVPTPPTQPAWAEPPRRIDATALTHPDLSDLVSALSDPSLAFLLVTTIREARQRLTAQESDAPDDEEEAIGHQPNPLLIRALRTALMDLTESD